MAIETVYADAVVSGNGWTNAANAVGSGTGSWAGDLNTNSNYSGRWTMADPVNGLTSGATQTIKVLARKGSNSGTPTIAINLYDNGVLVRQILAATNVTSTTGQTLTATFSTSEVSNGGNVEIELVQTSAGGSPSARNSAQVDYIQFDADTTAASTQTVVANLLTDGATVLTPGVKPTNTLVAPAVVAAATVHAPGLIYNQIVVANVVAVPATVLSPDTKRDHNYGISEPLAGGVLLYVGGGTGGAQTITAQTVADPATVQTPTVTPGAVTVVAPVVSAAATVLSPQVQTFTTVEAPVVVATATLLAPTVAVGAVTIAAPVVADADTVHTPTVTVGAVTVAAPTVSAAATVHDPRITSGVSFVDAPTVAAPAAVHDPAVTATVTVTAALLAAPSSVLAPAVSVDAATVLVPLVVATTLVYDPVVKAPVLVVLESVAGDGYDLALPELRWALEPLSEPAVLLDPSEVLVGTSGLTSEAA